jgi:type II secretory pathway component PulF
VRPNSSELWILGSGMCALLLTAIAVNLVVPRFEDIFAGAGASLPWLTAMFLAHRHALFALPLLPPLLLWWGVARGAGKASGGRRHSAMTALLVALGLTLLVVPLAIIAMYLPIFRIGDVIDG